MTPQASSAFAPGTNQLTGSLYDAAGNLTGDAAGAALVYDAENKLARSTVGDVVCDYGYDGDGRRVKKVVGGATTIFVYDALGRLIADYSGAAASGAGTSYLFTDHQGSVRLVTDQNGAVKGRHDYLPFGEEVGAALSGRGGIAGYTSVDGLRQKFTGYERDNESGLDYAKARYYSGVQGRFTSTDPFYLQGEMLTDPQRFNLYAYVRNNPLRFVDPDGKILRLSGDVAFLRKEVLDKLLDNPNFKEKLVVAADGTVTFNATAEDVAGDESAQLLFDLINAKEIFVFHAGTEGKEAAALFANGNGSFSRKSLAKNFEGKGENITAVGSMIGTDGRTLTPQPLGNVFAVIAFNTESSIMQLSLSKEFIRIETESQVKGLKKAVPFVAIYIHEAAENLEFASQKRSGKALDYNAAHTAAIKREALIRRQNPDITGGFAGGFLESRVKK